jgi:hypothetical protein
VDGSARIATHVAQSLLGALSILALFAVGGPSLRKLRHRLILGLAIVDVCSACAVRESTSSPRSRPQVLIPTLYTLSGGLLRNGSAGCQASGWFYMVGVVSASIWTLTCVGRPLPL